MIKVFTPLEQPNSTLVSSNNKPIVPNSVSKSWHDSDTGTLTSTATSLNRFTANQLIVSYTTQCDLLQITIYLNDVVIGVFHQKGAGNNVLSIPLSNIDILQGSVIKSVNAQTASVSTMRTDASFVLLGYLPLL